MEKRNPKCQLTEKLNFSRSFIEPNLILKQKNIFYWIFGMKILKRDSINPIISNPIENRLKSRSV